CLWTLLPSGAPSPCDRYKHACCSSEGHVYVLGGRGSGCLRDLWRYSVRHEWTQLNCSGEAAPEELEEHSMVAYEKQKWIPSPGKSAALQRRTPSNRKGHSAVVLASAMLLYGGLVDMRGSSAEFWRLDFSQTQSLSRAPSG
uniref:Si:dkey-3d4.3 n=1 Tax=Cynoglossus semilaevis TaxID=244447 RepID=A0A3P8WCU2_CYNSE